MKRLIILSMVISLSIFSFTHCSDDSEDSEPVNIFLNASTNVAPVFADGTARAVSKAASRALEQGSIAKTVYDMLRHYDSSIHEGVIDMHNIYKVLTTAGQIYSTAEESCESITEANIASPFDLGITDTYDCAGESGAMTEDYANGFAIKKSSTDTKYGLLTYRWAPPDAEKPDHEEHGILQGSYNETTGALSLIMIHCVDYGDDGFVVRTDIDGNATDHSFTIRSISEGTGTSSSWTSLVGKGISKGDGEYFLFKFRTEGGTNDDNYMCVEASPTEDSLEEQTADGDAAVDANCSSYETAVDAMTFLTTTDTPDDLNAFGGTIHLTIPE